VFFSLTKETSIIIVQEMLILIDRQKTDLVYCQSGVRSKSAVEFMKAIEFKKVYHMHEGIAGWNALRLKLIAQNI